MAVPPQLLMVLVEAVAKFPSLIGATNALKDKIDAAIDFADKAQMASLQLGKTYDETRKTLGDQIEGLRGSLSDRFRAGMETLNAGLTGNTMGVSRLINQQMLTGTAFRATADTFAKLEVALGLTREETNSLAISILKYNREYGVATDKLVQSLNALRDTMPVQKLVGLGQNFQEAIVQLQGMVGPQLAQELTGFVKTVLDPSFENLSRLAGLGILEQREQLLANRNNTEVLLDLLQEMIKTSADRLRMFGQGAGSEFSLAAIPAMLFGEKMMEALSLADGLGRTTKEIGEVIAQYYLTIQSLKKEIFVPIENALTTLHEPLMALYEVLVFVSQTIGVGVGKWLEDTLSIGSDTLKQIKIGLLQFSKAVVEMFYPIVSYIGTNASGLFRSIISGIVDGFINFTKPGGILTQLEAAFYSLYATILDVADFFGADIYDDDIDAIRKKGILKEIEVSIAEGAKSIADLTKTQQEAIEDFKLGGVVAEAFRTYSLESDKNKALTNLSKALAGEGDKPQMVIALEKAVQRLDAGLPLDEKMADLLGEIAKNTKKDPELSKTDFMRESAENLAIALEKVFGIGTMDSSEGIINAINNLNGTVQLRQTMGKINPAKFRSIEDGF